MAAAVIGMPLTANAGVENATYADYEGLSCKNLWNISRAVNQDEFNGTEFGSLSNKIRSSIVVGDHVIYAYSKTMVPEGSEESNDFAHLLFHNLYTGQFEKLVQVTVNGEPLSGLLCANQIGVDDFGNVWLTGLMGDANKNAFQIYHITDIDKGTAELVGTPQLPEGEVSDGARRVDYSDIVGDVTGKQAGTVFMCPIANDADLNVLGFKREQGSDTWGPQMADYYVAPMSESYPDGQTTWNGAPMIRIIRDDEHSGQLFYIDSFVTAPTLYNVDGTMLMSFADAADLAPAFNCNGCMEFSLDGKDFLIYTIADYDRGVGSQVRVARLGEGQTFEGMESAWEIPQNGFGTISDSGTRMFGMNPVLRTDKAGNDAIYLALAKCYNGFGVYRIATPNFNPADVETGAGVNDIIADDSNAPAEYFTPAGISVAADNLTPGLYIVRRGNNVSKTVIR